jgi:hypothetical protein
LSRRGQLVGVFVALFLQLRGQRIFPQQERLCLLLQVGRPARFIDSNSNGCREGCGDESFLHIIHGNIFSCGKSGGSASLAANYFAALFWIIL